MVTEWEVCFELIVVAVETFDVSKSVTFTGELGCTLGDVFTDSDWSNTVRCVWVAPVEVAGVVFSIIVVISTVLASDVPEMSLVSEEAVSCVRLSVVIVGFILVRVAFIVVNEVLFGVVGVLSPETLLSIKLRTQNIVQKSCFLFIAFKLPSNNISADYVQAKLDIALVILDF